MVTTLSKKFEINEEIEAILDKIFGEEEDAPEIEVHAFESFDEMLEYLIEKEEQENQEEEVSCPAIQLVMLYDEREALIMERDKMRTFVLPCEPEWQTKVNLDNQIIKLTEQIRTFRD